MSEVVEWIHLAQDRGSRGYLVNTTANSWLLYIIRKNVQNTNLSVQFAA